MDSQDINPSIRQPSPTPPEHTQSHSTANLVPPTIKPEGSQRKGRNFWLSFAAVAASILLAAMDLTAVSTILPTITRELNGGSNYIWVGSAYALASTATLPLSGAFADTFGRKPTMLCAISLFTLGSALAGASQSMGMIIAARSKTSCQHLSIFILKTHLSDSRPRWRGNSKSLPNYTFRFGTSS